MDAVVDDATCTLDRRFAAQVGNAIFRDDDFDGVFAVIQVGNHRYECADLAFLRRRRSREDGQHGRTGEVAGTADTVHHSCTGYVSGVDVTEYIGFQSRIDGHQAETAGYFRIVGDFLRAKQNLIFEEIQVRVDVADHFVADRQ